MSRPRVELVIRPLALDDADPISRAFAGIGWNKPARNYLDYVAAEARGDVATFSAWSDGAFAGYLVLYWCSSWPVFAEEGIPEIKDLNVLPAFRRRGIASQLLTAAEQRATERSAVVGIGVGMTADYGAAQRLYVLRGYVPDGRGLTTCGRPVQYGERVRVDDDLVLYFTRAVNASGGP